MKDRFLGSRWYRLVGVLGAVLLPAVAVAELLDLNVFRANTPISSSDVNENFADLNEKLETVATELAATRAALQTRGVGRYCGDSASTTNGNMGGYEGASVRCASTNDACGESAHMCTAQELVLSAQEALGPSRDVWYATGMWQQKSDAASFITDCNGYKSTAAGYEGAVWTEAFVPSSKLCTTVLPVACCE